MFRMYASNSHSYTHLILALSIVRKPTVWVFITSKYPGIHDIGLPTNHGRPLLQLGGLSDKTVGEAVKQSAQAHIQLLGRSKVTVVAAGKENAALRGCMHAWFHQDTTCDPHLSCPTSILVSPLRFVLVLGSGFQNFLGVFQA